MNNKVTCHVDPNPYDKEKAPNPNCKCNSPLWIVIPPGQHIHPCPVHPDHAVYSSQPMFWKSDYDSSVRIRY